MACLLIKRKGTNSSWLGFLKQKLRMQYVAILQTTIQHFWMIDKREWLCLSFLEPEVPYPFCSLVCGQEFGHCPKLTEK